MVALDLTLDDELRNRGLAREVVRLVQDLRKTSGLEVSDRIRLHLVGLDAIAEHFDFIAREVLAVEVLTEPGEGERPGVFNLRFAPARCRCRSICSWSIPPDPSGRARRFCRC